MPRGINAYDEGRIQGRNVANANSSNIVSPGIVTDGLVLHLDAGNYESYPISGTTLYDLSGYGNNGTLTNAPTYARDGGGTIDFDGTNDYGTVSSFSLSQTDNISVCAFIRTTDTADAVLIEHSTNYNGNNAFIFSINPSGKLAFGEYGPNLAYNIKATVSSYNSGGWFYFVGTCNRSASTNSQTLLYVDGQSVSTTDIVVADTSGNFSTFNLYIGARAGTSLFSKADIALIKIYNRALTPSEVSQNFNALRARFNI